MNLNQLEHFVAVAETGSVRLAAELLHVSQPAISRSLRALEGALGVQLLVRDVRGSTLTEFGKMLHGRARLIANEVRRIPQDFAELAGELAGTVRIACSATLGVTILPRVLSDFHDRYPKVELQIVGGLPAGHFPALIDGSLDIVLGPRPRTGVPEAIESWRLFDVRNAVAMRRDHPLRSATSLRELVQAEWVLSTSASHVMADLQAAFRASELPAPNVAVRADSLHVVQALVAQTDYVSLIPAALLEAMDLSPGLQAVEFAEFGSIDAMELFCRAHRPLSRSAMPLANAIRIAAALTAGRMRDRL